MTETQKRIKAYQDALPGLKEKVIAVALLLAMSMAMMTSATFAWLTISRNPEISGAATTIAANGNLEIALATGDGTTLPGESKVGDSSAAEGQSVFAANQTWGNLVNLSDPAYGLDNLALRPAQLNTAALLESPLYGALYGMDGRITELSSNFGYATWNPPEGEKKGYFGVSDQFGVRAISSTTIEAVGAEAIFYNMVSSARSQNQMAASTYTNLGANDKYMPSLATMMGLYMTARMNPSHATLSNPDCTVADIQNLRDMYAAFLEAFDEEAKAMAALANLTMFLMHGEGNYTPYTAERIYASTTAELAAEGIQISDLDQFIKDRNTIASDLEELRIIAESGTSLKWKDSGLNNIVNNLVNVGACTIGADNTPISSIGASNAASYMSGTQEARITNGILYRFEERTGGYIEVKELGISATVSREVLGRPITIPATVKANIQTTAPRDYNLFANDLVAAESKNDGEYEGGIPVAEDTYGLAVDLWVRTNAENSYLTLEGNVISETKDVLATGKDANGNEVDLYTVTISTTSEDGSVVSDSIDVYEAMASVPNEEGELVQELRWHDATSHTPLADDVLNGNVPKRKTVKEITVLGYEGENRVWNGENYELLLSSDSTTQGSGSCYVYYADTPEDQARSLKLLESFKVAFVNDEGKRLAEAYMDTEQHYAENGRVIVPLVLDSSKSINLGADYEGEITYAITELERNVATRITAIVYLDGTKLTNQEVLAAADIQGQLNIQFGSSENLNAVANEELASKERRISATVDKTEFDYDTATTAMITNVTIHVDGDDPSTITAFFLRSINATQGSREEVMTFTKDAEGNWTAPYEFTAPGTYVLRTVQLDGVDYPLDSPPTVTVKGFAIRSLTCDQASEKQIRVMTAAESTEVSMHLQFATDDESKLPSTVQARFLLENGNAVNIDFTYNSTSKTWSGTGTFLVSGEYSMKFLVLDGEYVELDSAYWLTANITLGMRVEIYTTSPHKFKYIPSEMTDNMKLLAMQVVIRDNAGNKMPGLSGVKLTYGMKGSGIKRMDADLTWNGTFYVGELPTEGPGIWQFSRVKVGEDVLTKATTSPVFTIQSPEPPEYDSHNTNPYQYEPSNNATMNVVLKNAPTATVQARIVKGDGTEYWVTSTSSTSNDSGTTEFRFVVPKDSNGYQDGNWTLTDLRLWDVFAADGTEYTEEAPLVFDVSDTNNKTKVVSRVYITFAQDKSADFGKDASGTVIGDFMQEYTVSGISVKIHDFENQKIQGVKDVKLSYVFGNNSQAYGGYTSDQLTNTVANFTISLVDSGDGINFTQSGTQTLKYAGSYTTTFSFTTDGGVMSYSGEKLPANTPKFTVSSISPAISIAARTNYDGSSTNGTTVTVTYKHSTETTCGITYHNYAQASVTLRLSGYGNAEKASLIFTEAGGGDVRLYLNSQDADNKRTDRYEWTGNGDCLRWVGYWNSQTGSDRATAAGTIKATALTLSYGGVEYTVDIADITIINPVPPS